MNFKEAREKAVKVDRKDPEAIKALLKQIGPYGDRDALAMLVRDLNFCCIGRWGVDSFLVDELHWPIKVARKIQKEAGIKYP